jgi:putative glutamine amidotransferase
MKDPLLPCIFDGKQFNFINRESFIVNRSAIHDKRLIMKHSIKIGITDCGKFENYRRWIELEPGVEAVKLSSRLQNATDLEKCDGVLFSGGEDLQPALYGKPEYEKEYNLKEILPARDQFEFDVIERSLAAQKPVLGICRGLQLINVFLGGTLVPDIPTLLHSDAHGKKGGLDQEHSLKVEPRSLLLEICGTETGEVNSAHHQSVDKPASSLKISAISNPSVVEAMEWENPTEKSWLVMVQWHPERMRDLSSPFSVNLKKSFLAACGVE